MMQFLRRCLVCALVASLFVDSTALLADNSARIDALSPSIVSDRAINPERRAAVQEDIAGTTEPSAIANGAPLADLLAAQFDQQKLPKRIPMSAETEKKVRAAIDLALTMMQKDAEAVYASLPEYLVEVYRQTEDNLLFLYQSDLSATVHLFNAVVTGPEAYNLGFNFNGTVGLALEAIEALSSVPEAGTKLLAQYIVHECIPERNITLQSLSDDGRMRHRIAYQRIQGAVFGERAVDELGLQLRELITARNPLPELDRAIDAMQRLLPEGAQNSREFLMQNLISTNLLDQRRVAYARNGKIVRLPPTFIFSGEVFPGYAGEEKPRYIILTSLPAGVAITSVFSKTKNKKYILAKGGCRWYQVGTSRVESMDQKMRGDASKNMDPLLPEGVRLAESMLFKSPYWESPFDGGKTIFLAGGSKTALVAFTGADKEKFVRDWVASSILAGGLMELYIAGPDVYMGYDEMGWIEDEKRHAMAQFEMEPTALLGTTSRDPAKFGTFPHEEWSVTSAGVVETGLAALSIDAFRETYGIESIESGKLSLSVIGTGDVGCGVMWYLANNHPEKWEKIQVRLWGNINGSVRCDGGIDKQKLIAIVGMIRANKLSRDFDVREVFKDEISSGRYQLVTDPKEAYFSGAQWVVPAARNEYITSEADIARMYDAGTRMYDEGANNSISAGLQKLFGEHGIALFDGSQANGGGIFTSGEEEFHAVSEGEESMLARKADRQLHVVGDIADLANANTYWMVWEVLYGRAPSFYEMHRGVTRDIIAERSRLLDEPAAEEDRELARRVEIEFRRGIARTKKVEEYLRIVKATEMARVNVIGARISPDNIRRELESPHDIERRCAVYWAGKLRLYDTAPKLFDILEKNLTNPYGRVAAVSLGYLLTNSPEMIPRLKRVLDAGGMNNEVRVGIEWALDYLKGASAPRAVERVSARAGIDSALAELFKDVSLDRYAATFIANLTRILREHPDKQFVVAVDTDIGGAQQSSGMMKLYRLLDRLAEGEHGKKEFPNLIVKRGSGAALADELVVLKDALDVEAFFVVAQKKNMDKGIFGALSGMHNAWVTAIDDRAADEGAYMPVFEAAGLSMMAYLEVDIEVVKQFYDTVAREPVAIDDLRRMLQNRLFSILPKMTMVDINDIDRLYDRVQEVYMSA